MRQNNIPRKHGGEGGEAVRLVREHLEHDSDRLVPLKKGGLKLLKISRAMGDLQYTAQCDGENL